MKELPYFKSIYTNLADKYFMNNNMTFIWISLIKVSTKSTPINFRSFIFS